METLTHTKSTVSIMIMLLLIVNSIAQNSIANKYRITAYQKENNPIMSVSNEVEIIPAAALYIPNAFTPDGDGLNDTFGGVGEGITDYNIQIFDRWGNLLFESNDINKQWDGNYKNELAPSGVYVFKVNAKGQGKDGKSKKLINKTGNVTLVI